MQPGNVPDQTEIADRLAILDILYTHSRGLDRLDVECLRSAYWSDATVDYGTFKGAAHEFAELVVVALEAQYKLTRHCLSNTLLSFNGSQARAESHVSASHLLQSGEEEMVFAGRYLDRLSKRNGAWKLSTRLVVMDWSTRQAVTSQEQALAELSRGGHLPTDPLYSFLAD